MAAPGATSREFADWAAGVSRALTDLIFQLARAKFTRGRTEGTGLVGIAGRLNQGRNRLCPPGGRASGHRQVIADAARKDGA